MRVVRRFTEKMGFTPSLRVSKFDGGLGFRGFEAFNMALLAGQWWMIVHHEESLVFIVL